MTDKETIRTSKFLSLILRHEPERVGLILGEAGWVDVSELLQAVNRHGLALTLDQLKHVVATSDKKRFEFSEDGPAFVQARAIPPKWTCYTHHRLRRRSCFTAQQRASLTGSAKTGCRECSGTTSICRPKPRSHSRSVAATANPFF